MRLLLLACAACGDAAATPSPRLPLGPGETLLVEAAVSQPTSGPIQLDVPRMVAVDRPLGVLVSVAGKAPIAVDVELSGPVTDTQRIQLVPRDRPCDKPPTTDGVRTALPTSCPALHGWVVFRSKLPAGEYQITARAAKLPAATATVPVAWMGLTTTYAFHPDVAIGDYRVTSLGFVKGSFGTAPIHPHRALLEHGGDRLVVDVIVNGQAGVIDRETQKAFYSWGTAEVVAGKTVKVERARDRFEVRWLTRGAIGWSTNLVRISGRKLGDPERRVIEAYLARNEPPPWPLRFNPMLGYTPGPMPGKCPADGTHCCMEDGRVIAVEGCDPQGGYPVERLSDGACKAVPCTLRCLPADAAIATPTGTRAISSLRAGDLVLTTGADGARVAAPIARIGSIPVTSAHAILEVELADGRIARGSTQHPIVGGTLGELALGDQLDGSPVVRITRVPYRGATWDLLPAGSTGMYWSDGVLLRSTLRAGRD